MVKKKKKKEKPDTYVLVIIAVLAVFAVGIMATKQTIKYTFPVYKTETTTERGEIEEKNVAGRAFKLDECMQDCQQEVCKKNCAMEDGTLEPSCFRNCLDECNNKCLKVYKW